MGELQKMEGRHDLEAAYTDIQFDLLKEQDCLRLKEQNQSLQISDKPMFSFMMSIYNDIRLLNVAVNSLLKQSFTNWELIIWDDSDENPLVWEIVKRLEEVDKRVHAYRGDRRVGWPKAVSVCLQYVQGQYTTFLAADDCIKPEALKLLNDVLCREEPDILWVGCTYVKYLEEDGPQPAGTIKPEYAVYSDECHRSEEMVRIMKQVYYNSLFHYMKVSFLKQHHIDFFEPYYMDCAGMTQAMAVADKMAAVNEVVYYLTANTSQTADRYTWDSYDFIFSNQWKSIKAVFLKEQVYDKADILYAALRVVKNLTGNVGILCQSSCRDKFMNPVKKETGEIIAQLEAILLNREIVEMYEITSGYGFKLLLGALAELKNLAETDELLSIKSWLSALLVLATQEEVLDIEQRMELIEDWILEDNNQACIGFEYFAEMAGKAADVVMISQRDRIEAVISKYNHYLKVSEKDGWRKLIAGTR